MIKQRENELKDKKERKEKMAEICIEQTRQKQKENRYWEGVKSRRKNGGKNKNWCKYDRKKMKEKKRMAKTLEKKIFETTK